MNDIPPFPLAEPGCDYAGIPGTSDETIAVVMVKGQRYEIDWPWDIRDEDLRSPYLAAIYLPDGALVDYVEPAGCEFAHESDVITAAMERLTLDHPERGGQA